MTPLHDHLPVRRDISEANAGWLVTLTQVKVTSEERASIVKSPPKDRAEEHFLN